MSAKGAPHDGQDTVKTLRTIIWYKRACFGQITRQPSVAVQPLKKDVKKKCRDRTSSELENSVLEINHVTNVTKVLNETTASDRVARSWRVRMIHVSLRKCSFQNCVDVGNPVYISFWHKLWIEGVRK